MMKPRPWVVVLAVALSLAYLAFLLAFVFTTWSPFPKTYANSWGEADITRPAVFNILCWAAIAGSWVLVFKWQKRVLNRKDLH